MRVVQVIPDYGIGGTQKAGCLLARGLAAAGHEASVVGSEDGPRRVENAIGGVEHHLFHRSDDGSYCRQILELDPDVIHLHRGKYDEPLIATLAEQIRTRPNPPLLVATPVFGRPPHDRSTLDRCRTCLIGAYIMYRMRMWLGLSTDAAMRRGIGYVWLNSFEATKPPQSTLDPADVAAERRESLGVPKDAFVFGRIGRNIPGKWHPAYASMIEQVLTRHPEAVWLSVGFPETERGRNELKRRFGSRFVDHPQTADYLMLARALASMDVQVFFSPCGECFSTTICEAAGVGLPTIAGVNPLRDNGQTEQIVDGVNGYLVATPAQAIAHLARLIGDRDALRQMKQSTYDYAHARWTTEKTIASLLDFYSAWRSSDPLASPYLQGMRREESEFAAHYRARMLNLLADGPISQLSWRMKLAAVANWNTFRIGRRFKQFIP
jgi:glycosyltransferase involved in cell wall biosynthesis